VTVFVYAHTQQEADRWARAQGLRPRDFRAYGDLSHPRGMQYLADDRVVILAGVDHRLRLVVEFNCLKSRHEPPEVWASA